MAKLINTSYPTNAVVGDLLYSDNTGSTLIYKGKNDWHNIAESGHIGIQDASMVIIGNDFSMSGTELKLCLKMLRKMAMEEVPEEFI